MAGEQRMTAAERRRWLGLALAVAVGLVAAALLRYQVLSSRTLNWICEGGAGPWWCGVRRAVNAALYAQGFGLAGFGLAVYAALRRRSLLVAAGGLSAAGILLWSPEISAAGLLLVALRMVRPVAADTGTAGGSPVSR